MFHSICLGTFCPDSTRSGVVQDLKKSNVVDSPDVPSNVARGGRKAAVASAIAPADDDDLPLDSEIKEWLFLGRDLELRNEECKGRSFDEPLADIEGWSDIGDDKLGSEKGEQCERVDSSSSDSSSSSSEDSGTSDAEMLMKGSADLGGVVDWKPGCVVHQNRKTKTLHLLLKGSTDLFICGRKASHETPVFRGGIQTIERRCKQCDRGKPLRHVDGLVDAFDVALKRVKHN